MKNNLFRLNYVSSSASNQQAYFKQGRQAGEEERLEREINLVWPISHQCVTQKVANLDQKTPYNLKQDGSNLCCCSATEKAIKNKSSIKVCHL